MDDLLERLRARNWRVTAQRRAVATVLAGEHVHRTADEIHAAAAAELPEISRATVYNTLHELVTLGEVREVSLGGRAVLYDPNPERDHQHLVCTSCGAIVDVTGAAPELSADAAHGYNVDAAEVVYRGRCPRCLGTPGRASSRGIPRAS